MGLFPSEFLMFSKLVGAVVKRVKLRLHKSYRTIYLYGHEKSGCTCVSFILLPTVANAQPNFRFLSNRKYGQNSANQ